MATNPMTPNQSAPLPSSVTQPLRNADQRGMYLPSDERRSVLVPPRGTELGKTFLPYDHEGGRLPLLPRGAEQGLAPFPSDYNSRPLQSRGTELGMHYPSDHHIAMPLVPRGTERGGIFLTTDDHALAKQVEHLHSPDARNVNVRPLFRLVQDIIDRSTQTIEGDALGNVSKRDAIMEGKTSVTDFQEFPELPIVVERISSEMTCKVLSGVDAHSTTLSVLSMLQHYSWEAKVVLTLAAFSVTYGDFWLLVQIYSTNALGKAMALIKQLPMVVESKGGFKQQFVATNNLIKAMVETTKCILEFGELPTMYITAEDPVVKDAMAHFPIAVYWIIRSAVAAATHITTMSSRALEYGTATSHSWDLSNWAHKLKNINDHLRDTLSRLYRIIEEKRDIDAFNYIIKVVYETIHIDNMKVLKVLIYAKEDVPPLFDPLSRTRVHLEVLRRKNVLLLLSDLDITQERFILEQSYRESKVHAYEMVWIPVLDRSVQWNDEMQARLENLQAEMPWYSVYHPSIIGNAATKFFREHWHFRGKPILVVLDPQGKVVSPNAIHMMWIWQNIAFPFTSAREETLWGQETWRLELLVDGIDTTIMEWIRDEKYIFLYGGDDLEWIRKFTKEVHAVARALQISVEMLYVGRSHNMQLVKKVNDAIRIEKLSHFLDETMLWYFWTRLESMIQSKIQLGKVDDHGDIILQELQRLHSYDKAHSGWAILAKGSDIIKHGQGKLALNTLERLEHWKEEALKLGFHLGYRRYYDGLHREENPCHRIEFPTTVKLPKSMLCPECRKYMNTYNTFICCHDDPAVGPEFAPAPDQSDASKYYA